jgi:UDP-N-acetylmuramoyl-tripeptide--D-alanyl-D-alanine ligase/cyanophycin synthetase/poly-gamma-glutamate synthesis protein (capsule biosynthesis protein)
MNILKKNNIQFLGMGMNEYEACRPLKFEINAKNISIYSGYWYRSTNQKIFKFYATPTQPGVAVLESMLIEAINLERQKYPNNFIIVIAHWGNDFLPVTSYQKNISKLLVENGANLIVGHGAHTIQSIEKFKQVPVLYSIGNGVFNSDGEFDSYPDALPYGMIAQLDIGKEIVLRIFPIKANNRDTIWQPDFVNDSEFKIIYDFYNNIKFDLVNNLEWPYYFEIKLEKEN